MIYSSESLREAKDKYYAMGKSAGFSQGVLITAVAAAAVALLVHVASTKDDNKKLNDMDHQVQLYKKFKATAGQLACHHDEDAKTYLLPAKSVPDFADFYSKTVNGNCVLVP